MEFFSTYTGVPLRQVCAGLPAGSMWYELIIPHVHTTRLSVWHHQRRLQSRREWQPKASLCNNLQVWTSSPALCSSECGRPCHGSWHIHALLRTCLHDHTPPYPHNRHAACVTHVRTCCVNCMHRPGFLRAAIQQHKTPGNLGLSLVSRRCIRTAFVHGPRPHAQDRVDMRNLA